VSDLVERLAESARRQDILKQYNTRMTELLENPEEQGIWRQETAYSELSAAEVASDAQAVPR
jgi:hypothetical protein